METPADTFTPSALRHSYPWKLFWVLLAAGMFGVLAVMPLLLDLLRPFLAKTPLPLPLPLLLVLQFLQSAILLALAVGFGLLLARKSGLGVPIVESWLSGENVRHRLRLVLLPGIVAGLGVGLVLFLLVKFVFLPRIPALPLIAEADISLWKRVLASFYGGIVEELLMRLFLLSLLAWLLGKIWRGVNGRPNTGVLWTANFIAAIIFGLGHLPSASMVMAITPIVVVAALVLNGIAALVFGYLYWTKGLEAAVVAHFSADIVIHVLGPAFLKT
ncbi:MAG: CPBP family glutamic-type intramembrane protease [Acidobacteriota bacterium]|nr:CPBP family glutamic-type intramembrane protease [Acidobacteriota bacterium]